MIITSLPLRGAKIVDAEGRILSTLSDFLYEIYQSNNEDTPKNNFRATAAPLVTNNRDEGYTIGSEWIFSPTVYKLTSFTGTDANWSALN